MSVGEPPPPPSHRSYRILTHLSLCFHLRVLPQNISNTRGVLNKSQKNEKSGDSVPVVKNTNPSSLRLHTDFLNTSSNSTNTVSDTSTASTLQVPTVIASKAVAFIPNITYSIPPPPSNFTLSSKDPQSYQLTGPIDNIDERDRHNPLAVPEYAQEMFEYFKEQEKVTSVRPHYLLKQPQVSETMRSVLVDWMINVQTQFKLAPETLFLAISLVDRFLDAVVVPRDKVQLTGVTALFIASKYEEVWAPRVCDFVSVCDNLYPSQEIVGMEKRMLTTFGYKITMPTAYTFLTRYLKAAHADTTIAQMSCYVLEASLLSYSLLQYFPSQLAAAAVLIARSSTERNPWSPTLLRYTGYYEEDIKPIARDVLNQKSCLDPNLKSVDSKYGTKRNGRISQYGAFLTCE